MIDIDEVKKNMIFIEEAVYSNEFYVALLLYDVLGLSHKNINEYIIKKANVIQDGYESIYNEDLREELQKFHKRIKKRLWK